MFRIWLQELEGAPLEQHDEEQPSTSCASTANCSLEKNAEQAANLSPPHEDSASQEEKEPLVRNMQIQLI